MFDGGEIIERVRVGRNQHATCCARCGRDLEVVRSARAAGAASVGQQGGVVTRDVDIEGDDVEGGEDRMDSRRASWSALRVGELDADEQLRRGDHPGLAIGVHRNRLLHGVALAGVNRGYA